MTRSGVLTLGQLHGRALNLSALFWIRAIVEAAAQHIIVAHRDLNDDDCHSQDGECRRKNC